jgi:FixJ family two-component response regulator
MSKPSRPQVLVVDDDVSVRESLAMLRWPPLDMT